jgi:serine/threonine-protein kinase
VETESGLNDSLIWIVMEYLDGQTLSNELQIHGRMEPCRAIRILVSVCTALEYAHERGIGHGAVDAYNVMITRNETVKLLNFGTADALDIGSDVYDAGWLLFELLNGNRFVIGTPWSHLIGLGFSWKLSHIVGRAVRQNPVKRYQSAAAMRDDLLRVLDGKAYPVWHRWLSP